MGSVVIRTRRRSLDPLADNAMAAHRFSVYGKLSIPARVHVERPKQTIVSII